MSDITCTEAATMLDEVAPVGCRAPWERDLVKLALLNRIADGAGTANVNSASYGNVRDITASTAIVSTDFALIANSTSGAIVVALPPAATANGRMFFVKRVNAGANNVTIDPYASETIDGGATHVLTAQWSRVEFISNGTAWFLVAHQ